MQGCKTMSRFVTASSVYLRCELVLLWVAPLQDQGRGVVDQLGHDAPSVVVELLVGVVACIPCTFSTHCLMPPGPAPHVHGLDATRCLHMPPAENKMGFAKKLEFMRKSSVTSFLQTAQGGAC